MGAQSNAKALPPKSEVLWEPEEEATLSREISEENRLAASCGIKDWSEAFQRAKTMKESILSARDEAADAQANVAMQSVLRLLD